MGIERYKAKEGGWEWRVDVTIRGTRVRESGFATKTEAEEFVVDVKARAKRIKYGLEQHERPVVLLSKVIADRLLELDPKSRDDSLYIRGLKNFQAHFPIDFNVLDLKTSDLRSYLNDRQRKALKKLGKPLEPGTLNQDLMIVSGTLRRACDSFPELDNWRPPRFPWAKKNTRGRERIITREEEARLLEGLRAGYQEHPRVITQQVVAKRDGADIFDLMMQTGRRAKEIREAKWVAVDFAAAELHLPKTKNGEPQDIPLNTRAIALLRRRFELRRSDVWVFPNWRKNGPRSADSFRGVVKRMSEKLGLLYGANIEDGFTPHAARHTVATKLMRAGKDPSAVQKLLGHSTHTMTMRYTHADREGVRDAAESLVEGEKRLRSIDSRQKVDTSQNLPATTDRKSTA